jgi:hypothetical protein
MANWTQSSGSATATWDSSSGEIIATWDSTIFDSWSKMTTIQWGNLILYNWDKWVNQ